MKPDLWLVRVPIILDDKIHGHVSYLVDPVNRSWTPNLELPFVDNKRNISCYPNGMYQLKYTFSPKFKRKLWLVTHLDGLEPDGRSGLRFHAGRAISWSRGCTIMGSSFGTPDKGLPTLKLPPEGGAALESDYAKKYGNPIIKVVTLPASDPESMSALERMLAFIDIPSLRNSDTIRTGDSTIDEFVKVAQYHRSKNWDPSQF